MRESRVKIGFIITGLNTGGAEMQLFRIITNLDKNIFDPFVISMKSVGSLEDIFTKSGIKVYTLGMKNSFMLIKVFWNLLSILKNERPSILTMFMFHAYFLGRLAGKFVHVPVLIASIRTINFKSCFRKYSTKYTEWMSDKTVVNSKIVSEYLLDKRILNRNKVCVIPNGIDVNYFSANRLTREKLRCDFNIQEGDFVWIAVGRFEEAKNYNNMIHAYANFFVVYPHSLLIIVGDGRQMNDCIKLVSDLGIENNVNFLGLRNDVNVILNVADAFIMSSDWEGMPNSIIEAQASGLPIVSTNVGGVPELVYEGENGFLSEKSDSGELARCMIKLAALPIEERVEMGRKSRNIIEKNYSINEVKNKWSDLFIELLQEKTKNKSIGV